MNIHGTEGMSAENIRDEVNRGARLVIYSYCISLVLVTLKRRSSIRLIKAGHSPVTGGMQFTLISLLLGWWGFPWGPIYSVQTIYHNLNGGFDVTDEVLKAILPASAHNTILGNTSLPASGSAPSPRKFNRRVAAIMAGVTIAAVASGISIYCFTQRQSLTVVLVSGLDHPYSVALNGVTYPLAAHGSKTLTLPEGQFKLEDAPGGTVVGQPRSFTYALPFFDHLTNARVAVINPDQTAVLLNEDIAYYATSSPTPADEKPVFTVFANEQSYFFEKPEYVIEEAEHNISMPSGTTRLVRKRLELINNTNVNAMTGLISEHLGYPAAREYLTILTRQRADETLLSAAMEHLKPEDQKTFFQTRLAERPVLVDWHRYYQQATQSANPDFDVVQEYREYLQADPGNGALCYLLGRIVPDRAEAKTLLQRAVDARPACGYAYGAFGFEALCDGEFAQALEHFRAAEKSGITSLSRTRYHQQAYWGLHQYDTLLEEIRAARKSAPLDLELAAQEMSAVLASGQDAAAAEKIGAACLSAMQAAKADAATLAESKQYLLSIVAYQTGHLDTYAEMVSHLDSPFYKFRAAFTRGQLAPAVEVIAQQTNPRSSDLLLLYMLAKQKGDESVAEKQFGRALAAMRKESIAAKQASVLLASNEPYNPDKFCNLAIDASEKCVLLTALGVKDPDHRAAYYATAAKLDFLPEFPHRFLGSFIGTVAAK